MANNVLSLIFEISANPQQAAAALEKFRAQGVAVSADLKKSLQSLAESSNVSTEALVANTKRIQGILQSVGIGVKTIGSEARDSMSGAIGPTETLTGHFGQLSGSVDQINRRMDRLGSRGASSIRQLIGPLRSLRALEFSTLGLVSVGFYVAEWGRVVDAIERGIQALQGYDEFIRTIQDDTAKLAETSLGQFGKLTGLQELNLSKIADAHERQKKQIAEQIAGTEKQVAVVKKLIDLIKEYRRIQESPTKHLVPTGGGGFVLQNTIDITRLNEIQREFQKQILAQGPQLGLLTPEQIEHPIKTLDLSNGKTAGDLLFKLSQYAYQGKDQVDKFNASLNELADRVLPKARKRLDQLTKSQQKLSDEMQRFQFAGYLQELKVGREFTKEQTAKADAIAKNRFATLKDEISIFSHVYDVGTRANARFDQQVIRDQDHVLRTLEHRMAEHARTVLQLQNAIRTHGTFAGENLSPLGQSLSQFNEHLRKASQMAGGPAVQSFTQLGFRVAQMKQAFDMSGLSLERMSNAMGKNVAMAIVYGDNIGKAMEKAAKATLTSIAAQAFVQAIYSTALGFLRLAEFQFGAAAQAFTSAAIFGMVGGAVSAIGHAIPGGTGGRGTSAGASRGSIPGHGLAGSPGEVGSLGHGGGSRSGMVHNTNVYLYGGAITDTHNLQNLITAINQGGQSGTVRLNVSGTSSTIAEPAY